MNNVKDIKMNEDGITISNGHGHLKISKAANKELIFEIKEGTKRVTYSSNELDVVAVETFLNER